MQTALTHNAIALLPIITFIALLMLQMMIPRRDLGKSGQRRVVNNLLLFLSNTTILRLLVPLTLLTCAAWASRQQMGLFNWLQINDWIVVTISILLLDCAIYWQHVATHRFNWLWRMHKVHHADHDFDVTTAIRFHPFELILSLFYKAAWVVVLGVPASAIIIFELLLVISPAFNHSNLKLSKRLDMLLRPLIVTPDMHRVHHSVVIDEQNSNYGFFLSCWDRFFNSYKPEPREPHATMPIGVEGFGRKYERIDKMLMAPFHK